MSFIISVSELAERIGSGYFDATTQVAENVRDFSCQLWSLYPDKITGSRNPGVSFSRGFMERMCGDKNPPPPPPPPPFSGGQCCDSTYKVFAEWTLRRCYQNAIINQSSGSVQITGKIIGIRLGKLPTNQNFTAVYLEYEDCAKTRKYAVFTSLTNGFSVEDCRNVPVTDQKASYISGVTSTYRMTSKQNISGADNCGDLPTVYPPTNPVLPQNRTYNITLGDTTNISYNVTYEGDVTNNVSFPLVFNHADFDVTVDLGGFNFTPPGEPEADKEPSGDRPPVLSPPRTLPRGGGGGGGGYSNPLPSPGSPEGEEVYDEEELQPEEETTEEGKTDLDYITIEVIEKPANAKRETGSPGDDIYYPGFAQFKAGGFNYPRTPLHFTKNILRAPDGADGYSVRMYPGFKAKITVYTRKQV